MRTNIELDEELVQEAMRYSEARSKRALVEEALRTYVDIKTSERRRSSYRDRLASIRGRTTSLRLKKSATDIVRADRSRT
jgi:Arc/MetJ family transcription regulator